MKKIDKILTWIIIALSIFLLGGCGLAALILPNPKVDISPLIYGGKISPINEPIKLEYIPNTRIIIESEAKATRENNHNPIVMRHKASGLIDEDYLELDFEEASGDVMNFTESYDLSMKIYFNTKTGKLGSNEVTIKAKNPSVKKDTRSISKYKDGISANTRNWLAFMMRIPDTPVVSGSKTDWEYIFRSTGMEFHPGISEIKNNSYVAGITSYKGRDHIVLILDTMARRFSDGYYYPLALHTSGYILIDKETSLHSIGFIKSRVSVSTFAGIDRHTVDMTFSVKKLNQL